MTSLYFVFLQLDMDKKKYFENNLNNLSIIKKIENPNVQVEYLCPLCMKSIPTAEAKDKLTDEHVPQASLGGHKITLTCRNCNSVCGSDIDIHLFNAIEGLEWRSFMPGTDRKVYIQDGGKRLNATLKVAKNELLLNVDTKRNNPQIWSYFHDNILLENTIIDTQDAPLKRDLRRLSAAILKNAYLILFARTGYTFLADAYYDSLRQQIMSPAPFILPERLWTFQNLSVQDGIYLTQDNRYRGFFIVYSLKLRGTYRVCVLIPTPKVDYLSACMGLRTIEPCSPIRILSLPEEDYLCDITAIDRLKKWCYGWSLVF